MMSAVLDTVKQRKLACRLLVDSLIIGALSNLTKPSYIKDPLIVVYGVDSSIGKTGYANSGMTLSEIRTVETNAAPSSSGENKSEALSCNSHISSMHTLAYSTSYLHRSPEVRSNYSSADAGIPAWHRTETVSKW